MSEMRATKVTVRPATRQMFTSVPIHSKKKRRVAAYARVSTNSEEQATSYEAQVDHYTRKIKDCPDWEFIGMYADKGITGCNTRKRDGFNLMIADALAGKIDLIITKSVSRFARNTVDGLSTIKKQMRIVTTPLKQAAALHQIPADPAVGIRLPSKENVKKDERAVEAYSPEEQGALFRVLDTNSRPGYAAIALMIETGLRVGEVLALRWKDVQISRKRLTVRATVVRLANKKLSYVQESAKSASSNRTLPLTPRAIALLERLQQERINEWVFNNVDNERLSYEALRHQTRRLCEEAKVEYRGEHVFRHTFATNCYYKGVNVKVLSKLLGHADVNVTYNIYIHLYGDGFDEMYAALVSEK